MNVSKWRKKIFVTTFVGLTLSLALVQIADAKSRSGGSVMGQQSSNYSQRQPTTPPQRPAPAPAAQQNSAPGTPPPAVQPQRSRWLGPLAGIAAGLGLGALMSHFGMGGGMGSGGLLVLIALAIGGFLLLWKFSSKPAQRACEGGSPAWQNSRNEAESTQIHHEAPATPSPSSWLIPASFDSEGFEHFARVNFVRLQAAWTRRT